MYPNTFKDMASKTLWPLFPRRVAFNWNESPLHWMPQSPIGSHAVNHFSFTLVRGEYFFCRIFNKALPFVTDEKLKRCRNFYPPRGDSCSSAQRIYRKIYTALWR